MRTERFLRIKDLPAITGLKVSTLYALTKTRDFPAPVKLKGNLNAWPESEVRAWQKRKIAERERRIRAA